MPQGVLPGGAAACRRGVSLVAAAAAAILGRPAFRPSGFLMRHRCCQA